MLSQPSEFQECFHTQPQMENILQRSTGIAKKNLTTVFTLVLLSRSVTLKGLDSALILLLHHEMLWLLWCSSWLPWRSPQLTS